MTEAVQRAQEFAIIVREHGKAQQVLLKYTVMILNFAYGMQVAVCDNLKEGVVLLRRRSTAVRAVFHGIGVQSIAFEELYSQSLQSGPHLVRYFIRMLIHQQHAQVGALVDAGQAGKGYTAAR